VKIRFQADGDFNRHIIAAIKRREPTVSLGKHFLQSLNVLLRQLLVAGSKLITPVSTSAIVFS
jgi:hypothetical protein